MNEGGFGFAVGARGGGFEVCWHWYLSICLRQSSCLILRDGSDCGYNLCC